MKKRDFLQKLLVSLLAAAAITAAVGLGILDAPDGTVSDALYQRGGAPDGTITVVGVDQRAIDALGPFPWPRDVLADVILALNADPAAKPAVIGVDVLFVGESADGGADAYLAEAAKEGGNVVVASAAQFGASLATEGDDFYMERAVLGWDAPYDALAAAAGTGHINAMADSDGILRHAMLSVDAPGRGRVPLLARVIYERWCETMGETPNPEPPTNGAFFYLPYTGQPGGYYEEISVIDVLNGEVDPEFFADRIVLIGPYAAGLQDEYRTAIDHAKPMYGVEIQANAIDAFRAGAYKTDVAKGPQLALLFALCTLALLFFFDRRVRWALPFWLLTCGLWVLACLVLYEKQGLVLHVLWPLAGLTVLFIASVAVNYIRAAREKRRVQNTFGHYIDPAVMRRLLEQGSEALELGGKLCDIAVLFVDIRGFTTMSEALDPPTVVEIINKYLTLTTECIMKNHGTLDKFVGDCTMAFWNAPVPQDDAVYLACCAAMDMVEGSKALGEELMEKYGRTVSFGVGVNWGSAVIGNIGAPKRMDYTAIGDTVNTAARLEANAPGGKVLISRAVADILGERARVTSLGDSIKLKGKADGFEILTLDALVR